MNSWKVQNSNRLLTEVKNRFTPHYTTKDLKWAIEHNRCFVNGHIESFCSKKVLKGDEISFFFKPKPIFEIEKQRILFEDTSLFVYNKPIYLTSEALAKLSGFRLVHRLDRDTSGVIVLAKNSSIQKALEALFKKRAIHKEYKALVEGHPKDKGTIAGPMGVVSRREGAVKWGMLEKGVWSKTHFKKSHQASTYALVVCQPITGRTHQIRVHLKRIGHPILGDFIYGSRRYKQGIFRPLLHASQLTFSHPITHNSLSFSAPLPRDFSQLLKIS